MECRGGVLVESEEKWEEVGARDGGSWVARDRRP